MKPFQSLFYFAVRKRTGTFSLPCMAVLLVFAFFVFVVVKTLKKMRKDVGLRRLAFRPTVLLLVCMLVLRADDVVERFEQKLRAA